MKWREPLRISGLKGVTIRPQIEGKPLDSREMWPFYEKISKLDVPIFVHVSLAAQGIQRLRCAL